MPAPITDWASQVRSGDPRAISRAISAIEDASPESEPLLRALFPHTGRAYRVGITGAPGAGKSTLVDRLAARHRAAGKSVGILAVDPSSPFTGGAILGDRVRMQGHATDAGIFIRSMATRGHLGGLAQAAADATLVLDAAGKDFVLIETVGVGQGEVEIVRLADCTLVVLVPGMGDDVQSLKAGVMEIADIFVLNKSDREDAARFEQQLRSVLQLAPERDGWKPPVVRTIATENHGVGDLAAEIARFQAHFAQREGREAREFERCKQRILRQVEARILGRLARVAADGARFDALVREVAARQKSPYEAADEILRDAGPA
ncbi:MAG TPA: methylmalonyl Co-A mutase-associated GTPase MeaB [Candidatus Acidoferrales bacterium]|nr:methylmalonyl Co-A mutase-associated GTPase MeaB [Candidatus Acidoferrales bacterium]